MLRRMSERYKKQHKKSKKKPGTIELSEDRIEGSIWEKG
jgi:hypothetical protein